MSFAIKGLLPWKDLSMGRELAAGIVATLLFFISALLIPVVGFLAGMFTPLPTLLTYYRWGSPLGYWVPGCAAVVGSPLLWYLNMAGALPYFLEMLLLGLLLGVGVRQGWSVEKTIAGSAAFILGFGSLILYWSHIGSEIGIFKSLENNLYEAISVTFQQYGHESQETRLVEQTLRQAVPIMVRLLPGTALSFSIVICWLNVLMVKRYCRIRGVLLPPWLEWSRWKAPEHLVWSVIACGFLILVVSGRPRIWVLNCLIVLGTAYFFQGLAIISFYFERWKLPRIFRAVLYGFLFLQQFATMGAVLMGLFDMWFDFRRLGKPATGS